MNILKSLTKDNQDTLNKALALLAKTHGQEGYDKAKALEAQLNGDVPLTIKGDVKDWLFEACEGDFEAGAPLPTDAKPSDATPFQAEITVGNQSRFAFLKDGQLAGEVVVEISKGTPAIHINTTDNSALAHIHFAHGGIVVTTDNPEVKPEVAALDRYAYHQESILIRHQRDEALLEEIANDAFAGHDFGFSISDSSAWRKEEPLHWVLTATGEDKEGHPWRSSFHVRFDERYEEVITEAYALDLVTGSDS